MLRTQCSGFFFSQSITEEPRLTTGFFFTKPPSFLITCKSEMTVCVIVVGYESLKQL